MAKPRFTKEYLDYIQFTRDTQWDWDFIHTWLKQTEDHVQYYYDTYTQNEFNKKLKTDENFIKKFGSKMEKQTALEWFAKMTTKIGYVSTDILEQAKQMEENQLIQTYNDGYKDGQSDPDKSKDISECSNGKLYYNETFKK
jgi:hypothetical protein